MRRQFGKRSAAVGPIGAALEAAHAPDVTVQLEDAAAASAVVETVDVLRNEVEAPFLALQFNQSAMGGIGRNLGNGLTAPVVPFPDEARIAQECLGGGQFLRFVFFPEALVAAESG